ncbi:uncharacterized protein LOC129598741 [Paramacrobiotus metropolitanus]|uniref:uncharacterized protein LOC129598741 n=1 Tax=Paramacrobiotus metropolitanus TaxID=2943436 RepID=UPI00244598BE|nr:uncharacterized protein LOC129598741 [Paramacrobiotus metropolitanus]
MENCKRKKHVLAIAYPAYGHTTPLLGLCRKLCRYHNVTFAVSGFIANRMREREFRNLEAGESITLYPIDDGAPADTQFKVDKWHKAHDVLMNHVHPGVRQLMSQVATLNQSGTAFEITRPVDVVIFDMWFAPTVMTTKVPGILYYYFNGTPSYFLRYLLLLKDVTETCPVEKHDWFQDLPPPGKMLGPQLDMLLSEMGPLGKYLPLVDGVINNSHRAVDQQDIEILEKDRGMPGVKIFCLGPFLSDSTTPVTDEMDAKLVRWLDKQKPRSVLYISFGSMAAPTEQQLHEIGTALLGLNVPFIWTLRKGHEEKLPHEILIKMSDQSEDDSNRSFWIVPWAPQTAILNHPSTGAYLSHCGWNSALESMSAGVPIVAWPLFADQRSNARMLVKRGAAIMMEGTNILFKRLVPTREIEKAIEAVLSEPAYRNSMDVFRGEITDALSESGSSTKELHEFVQFA